MFNSQAKTRATPNIIPQVRFNYKTAFDPEFKICWGLANLEPLWEREHIKIHSEFPVRHKKSFAE